MHGLKLKSYFERKMIKESIASANLALFVTKHFQSYVELGENIRI